MSRTLSYFTILIILILTAAAVLTGLRPPSEKDIMIRQSFTHLTGLPDLSVYMGSPSERFRSLASAGDIFSTDPFSPDTDMSAIIYKKSGAR
jgi:hypothetical protein